MLLFNAAGFIAVYASDAAARLSAAQSGRAVGGAARPLVQHRGELCHQYQLAELWRRKHAELSHPDGGADHAEFRLGGYRHRACHRPGPRLRARIGARPSAISGSISPAARSTSCCRSRSSPRCSWSGRACRRTSAPMSMPRRWKAPSRCCRRARPPRRSPSSNSAPMAAASGTPIRRSLTRTRRALSNFVEMLFILLISAALTHTFGRMVKDPRQGWALYAGHADHRGRLPGRDLLGGSCRQRQFRRARPRPRQHGRQGGALRHRQFEPVGGDHDGRLERLGQRHARQPHAARRADPACS